MNGQRAYAHHAEAAAALDLGIDDWEDLDDRLDVPLWADTAKRIADEVREDAYAEALDCFRTLGVPSRTVDAAAGLLGELIKR